MMSTTRMAMSHRELPRFLKLLNGNTTTHLKRLSRFWFFFTPPSKVRAGDGCCELISPAFVWGLPEGFVPWGVDDQHAGNLHVFFVKLLKHKHFNQQIGSTRQRRRHSSRARPRTFLTIFVCSTMVSLGTFVAPICCVIPPASPS